MPLCFSKNPTESLHLSPGSGELILLLAWLAMGVRLHSNLFEALSTQRKKSSETKSADFVQGSFSVVDRGEGEGLDVVLL